MMASMDKTDQELVEEYLSGDEGAFELLAKRHLKGVYSFILRFVGDAEATEDLTQETFLKAWKGLKSYNPQKSSPKTWLLRIARNSAIDFMRKRKHIPFSEFEHDGENILTETIPDTGKLPDEIFAEAEDASAVQQALAALPARGREVLLLYYTNDLTFAEIGTLLGEPANTVKSRHRRALLQMRTLLPKPGEELRTIERL